MDSHQKQQQIWEEEHKNPYVLLPMDSKEPSSGVTLFWEWAKGKLKSKSVKGLEIGCGKGRNSIWLSQQGVNMVGYDFSINAITEAKKRAEGILNIQFIVHDATKKLPYKNNMFDFVVDCFASTDIDSYEGREFARNELIRALKPGGYYFIYTLSTDDQFHKKMIGESPAPEKNAFFHPTTGKFEKAFNEAELLNFYQGLKILEKRRVPKKAVFFEKEYDCNHFWLVFQKPKN